MLTVIGIAVFFLIVAAAAELHERRERVRRINRLRERRRYLDNVKPRRWRT